MIWWDGRVALLRTVANRLGESPVGSNPTPTAAQKNSPWLLRQITTTGRGSWTWRV